MMLKLGLLFVLMMAWFGANAHNSLSPLEMENFSNRVYYTLENSTFKAQGDNVNATFMERVIGKYGDLLFFLGASAQKEGMMYGYNHPTEAYRYVMWFVFISIMAPLIIPLIYVIGFFVVGASWIKEKIKKM